MIKWYGHIFLLVICTLALLTVTACARPTAIPRPDGAIPEEKGTTLEEDTSTAEHPEGEISGDTGITDEEDTSTDTQSEDETSEDAGTNEEDTSTDIPPAEENLYVAFLVSDQCTVNDTGCTCTISYTMDAEDQSAGDKFPVTNVVFEVDDGTGWKIWFVYLGQPKPLVHQEMSRTSSTYCFKTFNVRLTATNSINQTVTSTGTFQTCVP